MTKMILAGLIFLFMYAMIVSEKVQRTVAAMMGGILMLLTGMLTTEQALAHIDFHTLGLLIGMMLIVTITSRTGLFSYVAILAAQKAKAQPIRILVYLALLTAVFSAFLDNVTTVLFMVPVTFEITRRLEIDAMPYLLLEILASNIGGTATLIGDPPNIMIGSAVPALTFMMFIEHLAPIALLNLAVVLLIFVLSYRKDLKASTARRQELLAMDAKAALQDTALLKKCLLVLLLVLACFFGHAFIGLETSVSALAGAFLLLFMVRSESQTEQALREIEWTTIFFFIGLFIAVGGLIETGIIRQLAMEAMAATGGDLSCTALLVLWMSALVSAFLDNIPFVATMIPLIRDMGAMGILHLEPVWWSLALGACLGGNGTIIGASANLIVAGLARGQGQSISFLRYFRAGFPIMLLTMLLSTLYVYWRYLG